MCAVRHDAAPPAFIPHATVALTVLSASSTPRQRW
jgi:hypothetical protein